MVELLVNIDVDDLDASVRFYTRAFELTAGRRLGPYAVELDGAGAKLYLLAKDAGTKPFGGAASARDYRRHWTPVHLDFVVERLEPALARALEAGAIQESAIDEHAWGRIVACADPWGHGFCLLEFVGRGYDELAGG
ncbi:MAG TPA: VOC family protein [Polyangia bacterium]|nr:VOC family protein [Polyangia bacterium]